MVEKHARRESIVHSRVHENAWDRASFLPPFFLRRRERANRCLEEFTDRPLLSRTFFVDDEDRETYYCFIKCLENEEWCEKVRKRKKKREREKCVPPTMPHCAQCREIIRYVGRIVDTLCSFSREKMFPRSTQTHKDTKRHTHTHTHTHTVRLYFRWTLNKLLFSMLRQNRCFWVFIRTPVDYASVIEETIPSSFASSEIVCYFIIA